MSEDQLVKMIVDEIKENRAAISAVRIDLANMKEANTAAHGALKLKLILVATMSGLAGGNIINLVRMLL